LNDNSLSVFCFFGLRYFVFVGGFAGFLFFGFSFVFGFYCSIRVAVLAFGLSLVLPPQF